MAGRRTNGEGSIFYRENKKKWVSEICIGRNNDGKIIRKTIYGNTRKEVRDKLEEIQQKIGLTNTFSNKYSIVDLAEEIRELKYNSNTIKRASYIRLGETIDIIRKNMLFGTIPIQNVTRQMINSEVTTLTKYSQSVISKVWQQMNGAYEEAKLRRIVNENPFELKNYIIKPKSSIPTKVIDSLTIEEEKRFIAELEKGYDEYTIVFFISIYTGMRISEILALERKDIDFNNRIIHVRKTLSHIDNGKVIIENTTKTFAGMRDIPILSVLYEKLLKYQIDKKTGYLFQNNGEFIHYTCLNTRFKKLCKYAGIRVYTYRTGKLGGRKTKKIYACDIKSSHVNIHMLRHTFATRCIENDVSPVVLQKILGHKDIKVTLNTYTSVFNSFKKQEIDKIDVIFEKEHLVIANNEVI